MVTALTGADVQKELQEYLNEKGINTLFIKIVENLLIEKPDDPVKFILNFLRNEYPESATDVMATPRGGPSLASSARQEHSDSESEEDEDEDEEEGDEGIGEMPQMAPAPAPRGRRISVSAAPLGSTQIKLEKKIYPKSDDTKKKLRQIVKDNLLFQQLDEKQMEIIIDAMFEKVCKKDDVLIKQGDEGDNFYVLDEGECDVFVTKDGETKKVTTCKSGDSFGELALMYNAPRAATVKAANDVRAWGVDRMTFKAILMNTSIEKREQYKKFVQTVPILSCLTDNERLIVADALKEEKYTDGQTIVRQGDSGDRFFLIKEGTAVCTQTDDDGKEIEVATLTTGNYFGEIALLTPKPRQATVSARGNLTVLSLGRKTFTRVMGNLEDILNREMNGYSKYVAQHV